MQRGDPLARGIHSPDLSPVDPRTAHPRRAAARALVAATTRARPSAAHALDDGAFASRALRPSWEEFRGVVRLVSGEEPRAALARWERDDGVDDDAEEDR